jgi:hypothetical protein
MAGSGSRSLVVVPVVVEGLKVSASPSALASGVELQLQNY